MSAVPRTPVARPEIAATAGIARRRPAWLELATSGDHKAVGVLYVAAALGFLALALTELVLMRVQLIVPESTLIGPEIFDQLLSAYGSTAIVLFGIIAVLLIIFAISMPPRRRGRSRSRHLPRMSSQRAAGSMLGLLALVSRSPASCSSP